MYARSTTIQAQPASVAAGIAHVQDQVLPALKQLDGFIGLSMMVDRDSGLCIATSAWQSEDAMRASADEVEPVRARAAEILGGSPEVAEWEIAVMHRDHAAHTDACVRSAWLRINTADFDNLVEIYRAQALPRLEEMDGFCSASFMVNRGAGRAVSSACFESRQAMDASRDAMNQLRSAGTRQANAAVLDVREFDLAVAHLRVPEMA